MNPDKLEALRRKAIHESTPVEEARTAAMLYVRNVGPSSVEDATIERLRNERVGYATRLESVAKENAALTDELRRVNEQLTKANARLEQARQIVARTKDLAKAAALVKQGHDDLDRQIREFEGRPAKEEPPAKKNDDPYRTGGMGWGVPRYVDDREPTK
jgi:type I site-specific restriction endonuclease